MITKLLEIRDKATFIPALAVEMNPGRAYPENATMTEAELEACLKAHTARTYLLRRCGYGPDWSRRSIMLTRLSGDDRATTDPYYWGGRTWPVAHLYITDHWSELKDGDVVDVEFILGETSKPKISERVTEPLP